MSATNLIVVALGGNAISRENEEGNVDQQFANSRATAGQLADLLDQGYQLIVTHGNGPQIGNFLLRNEGAANLIYPLPMDVAVAHVQGGMGFMIAQTLTNELSSRGYRRVVVPIITTVLVDADDPSFSNPTKPVGRVMTAEEARECEQRKEGWRVKEVAPGKFRRVVASPKPLEIMEIAAIARCVAAGDLLVACGGGGIPVIRDDKGELRGTAAVIDKDLASSVLAAQLHADCMVILTAVDHVCLNFGKPDQRSITHMTVKQARAWLEEGQFPPGSMGPKIEGALKFVESSDSRGCRAMIGPLNRAADVVAGRAGTLITTD